MTKKVTLWGGPHDGLEIAVEQSCASLRMPVVSNAEAMTKPITDAFIESALTPIPFVARYVRVEGSNRYTYAGQEKM